MGKLLLFSIICLLPHLANSAKVLFLPSTLYPVHPYTMKYLADELVKRGHEVTWVEYGPQQSKTVLAKDVKRVFWPVQFENGELNQLYYSDRHDIHEMIWYPGLNNENEQTTGWMAGIRICDKLLTKHKEKFDALAAEKFDTVIIDDLYNPCGLLQAGLKGAVFIYWSMTGLRTESAWANQSPSPPSYLPVAGTGYTEEMTRFQRVYNLAAYLRELYVHQHVVHSRIDAVYQKYYPGMASAFDLERNASINFVNMPPIFDFARPFMPRVNFVGGIHCHNATTLPTELGKFVSAANEDDGFIVVSSGFSIKWNRAPKRIIESYIDTFKGFPKTKFVWQYNGKALENLPENVIVKEWLPLQDLLGHKKCKAHITHGGLNSVIESVWHGVPVIGVPLTARGLDNLLRLTHRKVGVLVTKDHLDEEHLTKAIIEIGDQKYKDEMLVFQDMVRDVPFTELTHAAFWVEFIERHQEVPHARSGADKLNIFQYFLVDVILFLLSLTILMIATAVWIIKTFFRILFAIGRFAFGGKKKEPVVTKSKKRD